MTNFCSDNVTVAAPEVMDAVVRANQGAAMPYGDDESTAQVTRRLTEIFECPLEVFLVPTGTAANALGLAAIVPPYGGIFCHDRAHIHHHECGAPEFFSGGARLYPLPGEGGKLVPDELAEALAGISRDVHLMQPAAISISQVSELGRVYSVAEISALSEIAISHKLGFHMDGARFANAVAAVGCAPAEMTWRAGINVLSFGATKNGALAAESVILFDTALSEDFAFRRKRAGHLYSKMRFAAAQFEACLAEGRWLSWAAHANAMAARLAEGLAALPGAQLIYPVDANEIFVHIPLAVADALKTAGFEFYRMGGSDPVMIRLVTAFNTEADDVEHFIFTAGDAVN